MKINSCQTKISKIENLPNGLEEFYCYKNNISKIQNLPDGLKIFYCNRNKISKIENLPDSLEIFIYDSEKIKFIDNLPIEQFNNGVFNLRHYKIIKKLQKKIRQKILRNNAAKKIQTACHNWLWKPVCNDNTNGINIRISLKALGILNV